MTATLDPQGPAALGAPECEALEALAPVSLEELDARAALQTRVDRKYVLPAHALDDLLAELEPGTRVLQIGDTRSFDYESVNFDTPDLASYLSAARRRRRRFKVRTRTYLDSGECFVEVKTRGPRGRTVKSRQPCPAQDRRHLAGEELQFVAAELDRARVPVPAVPRLDARLVSHYRRRTLLLPSTDSRTTIDTDLVWRSLDPQTQTWREQPLDGWVVVETKTGSTPSSTDRLLWRQGHRPVRFSKYGTGMAVLDDRLPATTWRRVVDLCL